MSFQLGDWYFLKELLRYSRLVGHAGINIQPHVLKILFKY